MYICEIFGNTTRTVAGGRMGIGISELVVELGFGLVIWLGVASRVGVRVRVRVRVRVGVRVSVGGWVGLGFAFVLG